MTGFRVAPADDVRRFIAATILGQQGDVSHALGRITLRAHQIEASARLIAMIERDGGAMLAEPVGLGKTYTALAAAAELGAKRLVVTIPAALRDMWTAALHDCGMDATLITHEALSRSGAPRLDPGLVIVDESHRLRNPRTKRYAAVAELCARTRVLLVTATPVQNARDDLAAQLALFLGRAAWTLSDADIAWHVVRGTRGDAQEIPRLDGPHLVPMATDDDCVDELLALPPPVPAKDESTAAVLLLYGLVHQWTSSRAALVAALERRFARGIALTSALESGRRPTRGELSAWAWSGDSLQLAFPEIVAHGAESDGEDISGLLDAVRTHQDAIGLLLERLRRGPNPDDERADAIQAIRRRHTGERVIAFCHYTETVRALWSRLGRDAGVAALTASGARVAGGRVNRASVLEQFTPRPNGRAAPRAERIDLLIATDVLSEGLNLHEASVVIHLDYPWNPARLDQRVGRVRRLGSTHGTVNVYALAPPASAERLLRIDERLRDKLRIAQRTIGVAGHILPSVVAPMAERRGTVEAESDVRDRLRRWLQHGSTLGLGTDEQSVDPFVAAVASRDDGLLAMVVQHGEPRLVADVGAGFDASPEAVRAALEAGQGPVAHAGDDAIDAALQHLRRWMDERFGASTIDLPAATASRSRRLALARVAQALSRAPRHRRALLAPLAHAARSVAVAPLAEGAERVLDSLVECDLPDEAWLRSIAAFGEVNVRTEAARRQSAERGRVIALLLLVSADVSRS